MSGLTSDFNGTASAEIICLINDLMDIELIYKATWVDYKEGTNTIQSPLAPYWGIISSFNVMIT